MSVESNLTTTRKKICLIVDNPLRDLDGLVLLAWYLAKKNAEVFLVPMYTQGYDVPAICPDFVLLNYARSVNTDLIKAYYNAGISVGILDTEGGIWESEEQYVKSINHHECSAYIDLYCLWGDKQYEALLKYTDFKEYQLTVSGCPRYDFYQEPWIETLELLYKEKMPMILIISNFSLAFPRFARSVKNEINNMIRAGYEENYVINRVNSEVNAKKMYKEIIRKLSEDFPSVKFIIRPHPFESENDYMKAFNNTHNIAIRRDGTIAPWIKAASIMIHLNSSTAIDTFMMGKTPITLDWINDNISRGMSQLSYEVSYKCQQYSELQDIINSEIAIYYNKHESLKYFSQNARNKVAEWFHLLDGRASERAAESIIACLDKKDVNPSQEKCKRMTLYGSRNPRLLKGWIDGIGRLTVGPNAYNFLRTWVLTRNIGLGTKHSKRIDAHKVDVLIKKINKIDSCNDADRSTKLSVNNVLMKKKSGNCLCIFKNR